MLKESLFSGLFFVFAILFVVLMNIQGYFIVKLNSLLRKKYSSLQKKLILYDFGFALFIPRISFLRYMWFGKSYPNEINYIIKRIRLFQKLGVFSLVLLVFGLLIIEKFM